ncbi:unnamed protein product [Moneuplotes crassus]|uniref:Uncharacterized protein n=1 Tax=Euplotes crassus TaxID=5936 RepID=A0AAD1X981_EUPCR|nr:unnamed protein product [Moneuplotes crassus]
MVRKTDTNTLEKNLLVCSLCMMTTYSDQDSEPIPDIDVITESLNLADHNIEKIEFFKTEHGLHQVWHTALPQLEGFKTTCNELKKQLQIIKRRNNWEQLVLIHLEVKDLINSLFCSEIMKNYTKQRHCIEFRQTRGCNPMVSNISQGAIRDRIEEILQINPFKEALVRASRRDTYKNAQLERLEQDKRNFEDTIRTLSQEKNNFEQVSSQRQLEIDHLTQQIQTFERDQEQHNRQAEEMKQEILVLEDTLQQANSILENTLHQSKHTLDYTELKAIHNAMKESSDSYDEDSELTICVSDTSDQELLKTLQLFKLPPLKKFSLNHIYAFNEPELISKFLSNALSSNVKYFHSNAYTTSCIELTPYMATLTKTLPLIPSRVDLINWAMTKSQFQDLLVAAQNTDYVQFRHCKIDSSAEVDFGGRLDQATFTNIDFEGTGHSIYSNWNRNGFEKFKNIVKGLAKVESVKNRRVSIYLGDCGMSRDQAQSILQENGMTNMIIEGL